MKSTLLAIMCSVGLLSACQTTGVTGNKTDTVSGNIQCETPQMSMQYWEDRLKSGDMRPLNPAQRQAFLSNFNSVPPVSDYNPEEVILLYAGQLTMALFRDKGARCVNSLHPIHSSFIISWLRGV